MLLSRYFPRRREKLRTASQGDPEPLLGSLKGGLADMISREKDKERRGKILVPQAKEEMEELKEEVARELHLNDDIARRGWENLTTREVGKIGGQMVRRLVKEAEKELAEKATKPASPAGNRGPDEEFTPRQNQ